MKTTGFVYFQVIYFPADIKKKNAKVLLNLK